MWRRSLSAWLAAMLLGLSGCLVGPDYVRPDTPMPDAYAEEEAAPAQSAPEDARWWRQFGDPQLTALVEATVSRNDGVAVAEARLREARAGREMIQAQLSPQVGVGASVLRFRGSQSALDLPSSVPTAEGSLFQAGFDAVWVVDVFGGTRRMVQAARANEQAVEAVRRGVVLMVAAETARAYLELRGVQRQLQVARTTLQDQRQTLAITEDKRGNGLASDLEVVRARTEVEATAAQLPPLEHAIRQYIHVLSTLQGLEPTALSAALEPPAPLPSAARVTVGIPSDLLRRRPDIQAVERQLEAATAEVGVAVAQLFPRVVLGGTAGLASQHTEDLFTGDSSGYYAAGPSVNWTLFDGGRRQASIELSEARVDAAKATYEDTVRRAFREVESALVAVDRARVQVEDLKRLSASAREAVGIARRDYERGILDQLTVLDAQRQSDRADILLAHSETTLTVHTVTLYKALGGGWETEEPTPEESTP